MRHHDQPLAVLQVERSQQLLAQFVGRGDGGTTTPHHRVAKRLHRFGEVVARDGDGFLDDGGRADHPDLQPLRQRVVLHDAFVRPQRLLQRREVDCRHCFARHGSTAAHGIEQRTRAAVLTHLEGLPCIADIAVQADRALEHRLQIGEQPHLEFFAAKARAHGIDTAERMADGVRCGLLLAQRQLAAGHAVPRPELVVAGVRTDGAHGELPVQIARFGRLVFCQQQAGAGAVELRGQRRLFGRRDGADDFARAHRIARLDQRIDQRRLDQRCIALGAVGERDVVAADRAGIVAAAGLHIAQNLVRRADHQLGFARRVLEGLTGKVFGLVELAGIAVDDSQIAVGHREQVGVFGGVGQVQRLAGGPHALTEFTGLGERDGLAAILIARQLDGIVGIQHGAVVGEREQRVGVGEAGLLLLAGSSLCVGSLLCRCRLKCHQKNQGDHRIQCHRTCNTSARDARHTNFRKPFHSTPARGPQSRAGGTPTPRMCAPLRPRRESLGRGVRPAYSQDGLALKRYG